MRPHENIIMELARERERQIASEGWTPEHDDAHDDGQMAKAAAVYCWFAALPFKTRQAISMSADDPLLTAKDSPK